MIRNNLFRRLLLSHLLLLVIMIILLGGAMVTTLWSKVILVNFSNQLTQQARLVGELSEGSAEIWSSDADAARFVEEVAALVEADITLADGNGRVLASSLAVTAAPERASTGARAGEEMRGGEQASLAGLPAVVDGTTSVSIAVTEPGGQALGIVRLDGHPTSLHARFEHLQSVVIQWLTIGGLFAMISSAMMAISIRRPLRQLSLAVERLSGGEAVAPLAVRRTEETQHVLDAVNQLVERLQLLAQSRRRLLDNLVHEFSRPLGAILCTVEALASGAARDEAVAEELLGGVRGEMDTIRRLLDDLTQFEFHRITPLELECRAVPLLEWLRRSTITWRTAAREKGLTWSAELPAELPEMEIDPARMTQAVGNLLSNALKYAPAGHEVGIAAGVDKSGVWIRVRDSGTYIPTEEQARLFEPLYRGSPNLEVVGKGLGLSIAHDIVAAHGGELSVSSDRVFGTAFTIRLPERLIREAAPVATLVPLPSQAQQLPVG